MQGVPSLPELLGHLTKEALLSWWKQAFSSLKILVSFCYFVGKSVFFRPESCCFVRSPQACQALTGYFCFSFICVDTKIVITDVRVSMPSFKGQRNHLPCWTTDLHEHCADLTGCFVFCTGLDKVPIIFIESYVPRILFLAYSDRWNLEVLVGFLVSSAGYVWGFPQPLSSFLGRVTLNMMNTSKPSNLNYWLSCKIRISCYICECI